MKGYSVRESRKHIIELSLDFAHESKVAISKKNKSAAKRARKISKDLEVALRIFRKISVSQIG